MMHLEDDLVSHAAEFAQYTHISQVRKYTGEPYFNHLVEVGVTLEWAGCEPEVVAAGYLHDCIEDQGVHAHTLVNLFGATVAQLVLEVTDVSKPSDGNRAFRKRLDAEHLAGASPEGQTIKLADIISNTRSIVERDPNFARVYIKENKYLLSVLNRGNKTLWDIANRYVNSH